MFAAMDGERGLSGVVQATSRSGDARENQSRSAEADRFMGEPVSGRGWSGTHSASCVQVGKAKAAYWQNIGRGGADARERSDRNRHGFDRRRRITYRHDLFPHV